MRLSLTGHAVVTTAYRGWDGKSNGALVAADDETGFDVFITADQGLNYQQNMKGRKLFLLVLSTNKNSVAISNAPKIRTAIDASVPGSFAFVDLGH